MGFCVCLIVRISKFICFKFAKSHNLLQAEVKTVLRSCSNDIGLDPLV